MYEQKLIILFFNDMNKISQIELNAVLANRAVEIDNNPEKITIDVIGDLSSLEIAKKEVEYKRSPCYIVRNGNIIYLNDLFVF